MARTVRARRTDPITSHLAADSVDNVTATQAFILRCLKRPRNDVELVSAYNAYKTAPRASESGIRSRRAELVDRGLVVDTGARVKLTSGRYSIVWGLANVGR
jgi:hypothetical protein